MKIAVDTSALISIFKGEEDGQGWLDLLVKVRHDSELLLCDVVYAELSPAFENRKDLDDALLKLGLRFDPLGRKAAFLAGRTFRRYRREGGPRTHMVPDFLIAAHAAVQADRLAAADRGYLRRYFPALDILGIY